MVDPIEIEAPDDTGSPTFRRYEYQVHIAVQAVLEMLAGGTVQHITCEQGGCKFRGRAAGRVVTGWGA